MQIPEDERRQIEKRVREALPDGYVYLYPHGDLVLDGTLDSEAKVRSLIKALRDLATQLRLSKENVQ